MTVTLHQDDLPPDLHFGDSVAVDCETMGLNLHRDRLCLIELSAGDGTAHRCSSEMAMRRQSRGCWLTSVVKLFHFARFDVAAIEPPGVTATPVYCTKIASKLVRTLRIGMA